MTNNAYKQMGKQVVSKPKGLRVFGVILGIISLLALIGGVALAVLYPMFIDTKAYNIMDAILNGLTESDGLDVIFFVCMTLAIVLAILFAFINVIQMLGGKTKANGNREIIFHTGLIVVFFWLMEEFALYYESFSLQLRSLGFTVFEFATMVSLGLGVFYKLADLVASNKLIDKSGKKFSLYFILSALACVIAIVGGVLTVSPSLGVSIDRYMDAEIKFVSEFKESIVALIDGVSLDSILAVVLSLARINIIAGIFVVIIALLFNVFKFGADKNYVRASNYFSHSIALFSAGNFAFTLALDYILTKFLAGTSIVDAITSFGGLVYLGIFVVVLIICIICAVLAGVDKSKARKEEQEEIPEIESEEPFDEITVDQPIPVEEVKPEPKPVIEEVKPEPKPEPTPAPSQEPPVPEGYTRYVAQPNQSGGTTVIYIGQPMANQQPVQVQQPVVAPQPVPVVIPTAVEEEEEAVTGIQIERKTFDEKYAELTAKNKKYCRDIIKYAESLEGVKRSKTTYADSVIFGRDCIVKVQIKQGKVVCNFSLLNYEVKNALKGVKEQTTVIKINDDETFAMAKNGVDMAYKLALDAKEEKHQEQLRKRREARASQAESASTTAKKPTTSAKPTASKPATSTAKKPTIVVKKSDKVIEAEEMRKANTAKKPTASKPSTTSKKPAGTAKTSTTKPTSTTAKKPATTTKKASTKK